MSNDRSPLLSKEECDSLLLDCSLRAMHAHKLGKRDAYFVEINSLAIIFNNLITRYHKTPHSIIAIMEKALSDDHDMSLKELDQQIKKLFYIRKLAPVDTFYGEQEIIKITTQITLLEEKKTIPIKDIIETVVSDSFNQAIKIHGTEMPSNFNISQYEYQVGAWQPQNSLGQ